MPNLRIASLRLGRSTDDLVATHVFYAASLLAGEQILSALPVGLEKLSLTSYPGGYSAPTFRTGVPSGSAIFDMLNRVNFPNLKTLELWYHINTLEDLPSDELLLASLPRFFPLLRDLTVHRLVSRRVPKSRWDPVPIFRKLLPEFKHLRKFSLDPNIPERSGWPALERMDAEYAHLVKYLYWVAEEIVSMAPWLQEISMYRPVEMISPWERWDVIAVPGENIHLRAHFQDRYPPDVLEILAGPPTTEYRFELEDG
ncbi:hypothetical protein B0H10DRAFT_2003893 [Mycena sp. CBHHK59/15]|nr:hypothetical protein B0H10DRAFT_2003893 [Mycena sp. CBHHK59/15]